MSKSFQRSDDLKEAFHLLATAENNKAQLKRALALLIKCANNNEQYLITKADGLY